LSYKLRGIRGATTVKQNVEEEILQATELLLRQMIQENQVKAEDVASVWITVTEDLSATFPAKALRKIEGWNLVPVMCAKEIPVPGSLAKCIRVMMNVNTTLNQDQVNHVYLNEAIQLRPDLNLTKKRS